MIVLPVLDPEPDETRAERLAQQQWDLADVAFLAGAERLRDDLAGETDPTGLQERYAARVEGLNKAADRISDAALREQWLAEQGPRLEEQFAAIDQRADDLEYERVVREVTAPLTLIEQARWMTDEDARVDLSDSLGAVGVPMRQTTGFLDQTNVGQESVPWNLVEGRNLADSALAPVSQVDKEATETIRLAAMSDEERKRLLGGKPDVVGSGGGGGYSSGRTAPVSQAGAPTLSTILRPGGEPVGVRAKGVVGDDIRTVTPEHFKAIQSGLLKGSRIVEAPPSYTKGTWYQRADGSKIGIRSGRNGITIDVIETSDPLIPGGFKVHQK